MSDKYDENIDDFEIFEILFEFFKILQNTELIRSILNGNIEALKSIRFGFCQNFDELMKIIVQNVLIDDEIVKLKLNFKQRIFN